MAFKKEVEEIIEPKDIFVGKKDAPVTLMEFGEYENEDCAKANEVVKQGQYVFDTFWHKAIPAEDRIREIEEGIKPDFIETIRDPTRVQNIAFDLVKSSKEEILTIFSTSNAFFRQERTGGIALLNEAAKYSNRNVRILVPYDAKIEELIKSWEISNNTTINKDKTQKIVIRFLDPAYRPKFHF